MTRIVSQPFWLWWSTPAGKRRRHVPDFLVLLEDGSDGGAVLDSWPLELIEDTDRAAFDATDRACALLDWRYAVWDRLDGVVVANQKWLAGYRHPRYYVEPVAERLLEVFTRSQPLMDGAEAAGDPLETLPVLYHLIWTRRLLIDLSLVLSDRTIVRTAPDAGWASKLAVAELQGGGRRG